MWRRDRSTLEEVPLSALPLGFRLGDEFPEAALDLAPGDTVLISTDGLAEVVDPDGESWGYDRVAEAYGRAADGEAEAILDALLAAAETFGRGCDLPDDVTLVAIQARERRQGWQSRSAWL